MTPKHTPGPWTVGTHLDEGTDLTRGEYVVFPIPHAEETEANGRLIAAAPELLELVCELEFFLRVLPSATAASTEGPRTRLLERLRTTTKGLTDD